MTTAAQIQIALEVLKKNSAFKHPSMPQNMAVYVHGDVIKGKLAIDLPEARALDHRGV